MTLLYKNIFKWTLMLGLMMSALFANAVTYTVSNTSASPATVNSLPWALAQPTPTIINITATGTLSVKSLMIQTAGLVINSNVGFIIDGGGTYNNAWGTDLICINAANVTINDLIIQNAKQVANAWEGNGFNIGANNVSLNRCSATNSNQSGYITACGLSNINLTNCIGSNNNAAGFNTSTYNGVAPFATLQNTNFNLTSCTFNTNKLSGLIAIYTDLLNINGGNFNSNGEHGIYFNGSIDTANTGIGSGPGKKAVNILNKKGVTNSVIDGVFANSNGTSGFGGGICIESNSNFNVVKNCSTSTNKEHGLWLRYSTNNNQILNCYTTNNGLTNTAQINGINISLSNNKNNLIKGNFSSGNKAYGIYLYDNYGTNGNDLNFIETNTIVKNLSNGIHVINSNRTVIRNNFVGTDNTYVTGLGNGGDGIYYGNSSTGGELSGNIVINNTKNGINITAGDLLPVDPNDANTRPIPKGGSNNNNIFGNYVGIDPNGIAKPNLFDGIVISESFGNNVGRSDATTVLAHPASPVSGVVANTRYKNYISGNTLNGISLNNIDPNSPGNILNPKGETLLATVIEGNYIGTNLTGNAAIANGEDGIGTLNTGTSKVSRITILDNLISGNVGDGIQLGGSNSVTAATDLISIQGNTIGMNLAQTAALPNGAHGLNLVSTTNVTIGDAAATTFSTKSNLISGNTLNGIEITNNAKDINVYYNRIGTDPTGISAFPNKIGIRMVGANNNFVVGNLISGNKEDGIYILNANAKITPNTVAKNYIGTNQAGTAALANGFNGITLDGCNDNKIGTSSTDGNLISGNSGNGIKLTNSSDANTIDGNIIGLNATKNGAIPNTSSGISLISGAKNNKIGTLEKNIISGNKRDGIELIGSTSNYIAKNYIGVGADGVTPFSNNHYGISLTSSSSNNTIGGVTAADGNVVSGNTGNGIYLASSSNSNTISNNLIGTTSSGLVAVTIKQKSGILITASKSNIINNNTITNSTDQGITLTSTGATSIAEGTVIKANIIGLSNDGLVAIPNTNSGIASLASSYNTIGGANAADGNIVSGNTGRGIDILSSSSNVIQNNKIGTNQAGTAALGNNIGISVAFSNSNQILNNLVSGNTTNGIALASAGTIAGTGNTINSNTIGLAADGTTALKNGTFGIFLDKSNFNTIGATGAGNTIGNHTNDGISLTNSSNNNTIAYNAVGLTKTLAAAGNDNGISITSSTDNNINNNIVSSNVSDGIVLDGASSNILASNIIGTNAAASTTNLGNTKNGISLKNASKNNIIGTTNNIAYNKIAVFVDAATTTGNTITQNSIYCNTDGAIPGIQLSNTGNNNYLNPWISRQKPLVILNDPLNSGNSSIYFIDTTEVAIGSTIEYFKTDATCTNCKQGQTYVNKEVVAAFAGTTPATKGAVLKLNTTLTLANCKDYIVTITDPTGNTSQFSTCSDCATLCTPSTIATDPVNTTKCEGEDATFTATVNGINSTNVYQWQKYDPAANAGAGGYVDLTLNSDYLSATTPGATSVTITLTIKSVTAAMSGDKFRLKITTCGKDIFTNASPVAEAILTVNTLPKVTLDPLPTRLCVGGNYTFKSLGTGTGLTYQWQVANKTTPTVFSNVSGATSPDYTYSNIPQSADGNIYRVELKGDCPTTLPVYTDTAQLFVDSATTIKTEPVNVAICSPGNATFKVDVLGRNTATYQWQESVSGGAFANITDAGIYLGAKTTTLTLTGATNALIAAKYQLVVTGKCNPITSKVADLTFTVAPTVKTSPVSTPICEDANTTLTGVIDNATSHYWEVSTNSGATWTTVAATSVYSTVTTSTLTFTKVPLSYNNYQYRLVGEGACTPKATTSATILTVNEKPKVVNISSISPVCEGATATFTTTATGTNLSFQWKVSTDNGSTFNNIPTGTPYTVTSTASASTLDIVTVATMNSYKYQLEVSGTCTPNVVSNAVLLTVNSNPTVTSPADVTMCENATKTMSVTLGGTGVSAQWQIDKGAGAGYVDIVADGTFLDVATNTLTIKNPATTLNGAKFKVVAKGTCNNTTGVISANFATLTINTVPTISLQPKDKVFCEESSTGFGVTAAGTGLKYQWQVNTGTGTGFVDIAGETNDTLKLASVTATMNDYQYKVVITGTCKTETSNPAKLTVNRSPQLLLYPQSATICPGYTATFKSNALAVAGLAYQWQTDNGTGIFTDIVGATQKDYTTPTVSVATGSYKYQLVVSATCPSKITTTPVGITLTTAPVITTAPSNANICDGADVNFTVVATNATSYQWSIDGVGVLTDNATFSGTTTNSMDIKAASFAQFNGQVFRVTAFGACTPNPSSTATINFVIPTVDPILPTTVCDSTLTKIELKSTGVGSSGVGTMYVWSSIALSPGVKPNTAVSIPRGKDGKHTISELLDNTSPNPVVVQYTVTPYKAGCYGNPEIALVTVRPTVYLTLDGPYTDKCIGADQILNASLYPNGTYAWVINGVLQTNDILSSIKVQVPSEITEVEVSFVDQLYNCNHPSVTELIVPIPLTKVSFDHTRLCAGFDVTYTPIVPTNALVDNFVWTFKDVNVKKNSTILSPAIGYNFVHDGKFVTTLDAYYKGCKVATVDSLLKIADCSLDFRNTISPNGDNQNDEFEIGNIDLYPNAEISVFNRWGVIIWTGKNLTVNKFKGLNSSGELLEDGVYYYVLDLKTGSNKQSIKKGYITLMRTIP